MSRGRAHCLRVDQRYAEETARSLRERDAGDLAHLDAKLRELAAAKRDLGALRLKVEEEVGQRFDEALRREKEIDSKLRQDGEVRRQQRQWRPSALNRLRCTGAATSGGGRSTGNAGGRARDGNEGGRAAPPRMPRPALTARGRLALSSRPPTAAR